MSRLKHFLSGKERVKSTSSAQVHDESYFKQMKGMWALSYVSCTCVFVCMLIEINIQLAVGSELEIGLLIIHLESHPCYTFILD